MSVLHGTTAGGAGMTAQSQQDVRSAVDELRDALVELARVFSDGWAARQVGQAMACSEAEALAAAIRLVDPQAAEVFLRGHANGEDHGDDGGDDHFWMRDDYDAAAQDADHRARPDDDPEPVDRCKDCGQPVLWEGPSHLDWRHR